MPTLSTRTGLHAVRYPVAAASWRRRHNSGILYALQPPGHNIGVTYFRAPPTTQTAVLSWAALTNLGAQTTALRCKEMQLRGGERTEK